MQFRPSYLLGLNELVGLAYVQNLGLLMKRAPGDILVVGPMLDQQQYFNPWNFWVGPMLGQCQHAINDVLPTTPTITQRWPNDCLLSGMPNVGKTMLAHKHKMVSFGGPWMANVALWQRTLKKLRTLKKNGTNLMHFEKYFQSALRVYINICFDVDF